MTAYPRTLLGCFHGTQCSIDRFPYNRLTSVSPSQAAVTARLKHPQRNGGTHTMEADSVVLMMSC